MVRFYGERLFNYDVLLLEQLGPGTAIEQQQTGLTLANVGLEYNNHDK